MFGKSNLTVHFTDCLDLSVVTNKPALDPSGQYLVNPFNKFKDNTDLILA